LFYPNGPVGQAISYALANWQALCRYPEDGDLSIDNNLSERALRAQPVGWRARAISRGSFQILMVVSFFFGNSIASFRLA
jgi:hypothetical protein